MSFRCDLFRKHIKAINSPNGKHLLACIKEFFFNTNKLRLICTFAILSLFVLLIQFHLLNFEIVCLLLKKKNIYIHTQLCKLEFMFR